MAKTVAVSEDTHRKLIKFAAVLTQLKGEHVSMGEAVDKLVTDELERLSNE